MIKNRIGLDLSWNDESWSQYTSFIKEDRKYIRKINRIIKSIHRDGHRKGLGKPEPLKNLSWPDGTEIWSRRIDQKNRFVYIVPTSLKRRYFLVSSCKYHYHK